MKDQFPKVDCIGILGDYTFCTRSISLGELADCLRLELHEIANPSLEGSAWIECLLTQLIEQKPEIAILVGYSFLHHRLALFFRSQNIPVVLYEITPASAVVAIDPIEIGQRVELALGFSRGGSQMIKSAKVPYYYVGSPYKDRVDRIIIEPGALGFNSAKKIISIFPGNRREKFQAFFPTIQRLAASLVHITDSQIVICLGDSLQVDEALRIAGDDLCSVAFKNSVTSGQISILAGVQLELLALSSLAITGCGGITVECCLLSLPFMPIYMGSKLQLEPQSMLNQLTGEFIIPEYNLATPTAKFCEAAKQLFFTSPARDSMLNALSKARLSLQGFAAENAAEYIGLEIGRWKPGKRIKGSKIA